MWKARDTQLQRTVAIKIPRQKDLDPKETEIFLRDARAAAQLNHPRIAGVHEVGREDNTVYIVTDYIDGANLSEWLTGQRLTSREAAELVVKIAEALHHAHEAGRGASGFEAQQHHAGSGWRAACDRFRPGAARDRRNRHDGGRADTWARRLICRRSKRAGKDIKPIAAAMCMRWV